MNVTFNCSRCEKTSRCDVAPETVDVACSHCSESILVPQGAIAAEEISRCIVCPSDELFVRKDFSQRLGMSIILFGFFLSSIAWAMHARMYTYSILGATAMIDAMLFWFTGNVLTCYRCHSEYRGVAAIESHPRFDLEIHEKYRQQTARHEQALEEQALQAQALQAQALQAQALQEQALQEQAAQQQALKQEALQTRARE